MSSKALRIWFVLADCAWIIAVIVIACAIRFGARWTVFNFTALAVDYGWFALFAVLTWATLSFCTALDGFRGGWQLPNVLSRILIAVALLAAVLAAGGYFARDYVSRLVLAAFVISLFAGFVAIRCAARGFLGSKLLAGSVRRVVVAGAVRPVQELAERIERHPEMLWHVVGHLYPGGAPEMPARQRATSAILSVRTYNVLEVLKEKNVQELLVCMPDTASAESMKLAAVCRRAGIAVTIVPVTDEPQACRPRFRELEGIPLISMADRTTPVLYQVAKRTIDLVFGSLLLVIASPLILLISVALKVQKGRAFQAEVRCGVHGHLFRMYRLNIERFGCDLSRWESVLDRLSITEVPQLWNVLRGDMSLVGPRPEDPQRVKHYSDWQRQRLTVRPGVTGLAQVHGLRDSTPSEQKSSYDLHYIAHWSPLSDLALVLQTIWTLVTRLLSNSGQPRAGAAPLPLVAEIFDAHRAQSGSD